MYKLDKKMKQNKEITNRILDLINDSQEMTDSDIQGCLDAILLDYGIIKLDENDEKGSGGIWDFAGEIAGDDEVLQEKIYNKIKYELF